MSDGAVTALAIATWLGALTALPVPPWLGLALVALAFVARRPTILIVAGLVLATGLGAAAWHGVAPPSPTSVHADAVLVSDPRAVGHALRVDLRLDGRRIEAWARGGAAAELRSRLAGDVVRVEGRLRPPTGPARARLAVRHIAARLDVERVLGHAPGSPLARAANRVRRVIVRGADPLPRDHRALLTGFLLGDDRDLSPVVTSDFRAAGLTHLLAVSGQNLAFVLAVAGPILRRLELRGRFAVSLALIGFFAVLTRAEPSVMRASAMATIACWSAFAGRPVSRIRVLCLAVVALVLIDPMLPRSVGFQLSVGASLGLALFSAPIARRLAGPDWLVEPLAVTVAAQAGVAPVLITTFGGMPVITVVANLLAVPVAGPLTAWGLTAGFVAGVLGPPMDAALHLPTGLMIGWIDGVAAAAARVPLGLVDGRGLLVAGVIGLAMWRFRGRRAGVLTIALGLVLAARLPTGDLAGAEIARGASVWRDDGVVLVLDGGADSAWVLEGLRAVGVRRVDLLVSRSGGRDAAGAIADLRSRVAIRSVVAPAGHRIRGATAVSGDLAVAVGGLRVVLREAGRGLTVAVTTS